MISAMSVVSSLLLHLSRSRCLSLVVTVIRHRKRSFPIKQRTSADYKSIIIIVAVLEYHLGNLRILLQSSPRKELSAFSELSQRDQFSHP